VCEVEILSLKTAAGAAIAAVARARIVKLFIFADVYILEK
jgi:hypothetical protein